MALHIYTRGIRSIYRDDLDPENAGRFMRAEGVQSGNAMSRLRLKNINKKGTWIYYRERLSTISIHIIPKEKLRLYRA